MSIFSHSDGQRAKSGATKLTFALVWAFSLGASHVLGAEADVRRDAAVIAIERVMPSVVNIQTKTIIARHGFYEDLLNEFYGPYYRQRPADTQYSLGSGVIIDESGYVLTNWHVVQRANEIRVKLHDGRIYEAEPVGGVRNTDVALLRLRCKPAEKFPAATLAADDDLLLGETVLALGSPFGLGESVSRGILSSKSRRLGAANEPLDVQDWLQTDAAINPGNSGGPLINLQGEVIGINVAVYREGQGIGFAIPIKQVSEAIAAIFTPEESQGLWFGARVKPGPLPLKFSSVQPGSPAARAGLLAGDTILSVNGQHPKSVWNFSHELIKAGEQPLTLSIQRGSVRKNVSVQMIAEKSFFNSSLIREKLGATVQALSPETAQRLGVSTAQGLIIGDIDNQGPAAEAGLRRRTVIQGMDGTATPDIVTAAKILFAKKPGEAVVLSLSADRRLGAFIQQNRFDVEIKVR